MRLSNRHIEILLDHGIPPPPIAGGGGGDSGDQVVYQKSEPWSGMVPLATEVANLGMLWKNYMMDRFNQMGPEGWIFRANDPRYRVAPFSQAEIAAQQKIIGPAHDFANLGVLVPYWSVVDPINQKIRTQQELDHLWGFRRWLNSLMQQQEGQYQSLMSNAISNVLNPTLGGDYLYVSTNPYLAQHIDVATQPIFKTFLEQTLPQVRMETAARGRYGSATQQQLIDKLWETTARQAGDISTKMAAENLARERGLQMQASQLPFDMMQSLIDDMLQRAQQNMQLYSAEKQWGYGNIPLAQSLIDQAYQQVGAAATAGQQQRAMEQAMRQAEQDVFREWLYMPYEFISALGNLAFTGGQLGRTMTSTTPMYVPGFGERLLSGGMGGLGMYGLASMMPGLEAYAPYLGMLYGVGMML